MYIQTDFLLRRYGEIPAFAGGRDQPFWKRPPASVVTVHSPSLSKIRFEHVWTEMVHHLPSSSFRHACIIIKNVQ